MALFDALNSYEGQQALGLLAAAGGRSDGAGFGQRMLEGLGQGEKWKQQQATEKRAQMQDQLQQLQMQDYLNKAAKQKAIQEGVGQFFKSGQPGLAALAGNAETGILPSSGRAAVAPSVDMAGLGQFLAQNGDYATGLSLMQKQGTEYATAPQYDQNGRAFVVGKDGSMKYLGDVKARDKLIETDLGGSKGFRTEYSPEMLAQLAKTQSPDSKASNQVAWANNALANQRFAFDKQGGADANKPQLIDGQWVYRPDAQNPQGRAIPVQGLASGGKSTEGERTAATLLQRMRSSESQLEDAIAGGKTGAEKPSIISNALRGMGAEMAANTWDSPARQKVESAQLDILDAALTLGTGAAYTREQLEGYRKSYFPQVGDDAAAVKDKQDRLNNILKAAEIKAGNAAKSVPSVKQLKASRENTQSNGWSIQKVD